MRLYTGIVENRDDPLKLGRCQVRIMGVHSYDRSELPIADLPWAYPMQPSHSAAMNGIGYTPLGVVEGSTVVVMFIDDDHQQPVILGSLGGVPQAPAPVDQEDNGPIFKQDGFTPTPNAQALTDDTGQVVTAPPGAADATGLNPASSYNISQDGINLIKQFEGCKLTAYQDSVGIWTIGYGTTKINGASIQPGQTITQAEADQLLTDHITKQTKPGVVSAIKAPITQSMFDALCCFTYNVGSGTLAKSSIATDTNAPNYPTAANDFLLYNKAKVNGTLTVVAGLTRRRSAESALYLKDGVPDATGAITPASANPAPVGSTTPGGGTSTGASTSTSKNIGFNDPKGKYPLYLNEPDTNRLARGEEIKKTAVYIKEQVRELGVATAQGHSWDQSPVPYNAKYPFNHVFMSESGHLMEFDDTKNSERIHIFHKAGTYTEIDANGTEVKRIVGDKYEILERNGHLLIKGSADVTIQGDHNVKIDNALRVDVHGVTTINVFNDASMNVSGKMDLSVKESLNIKADTINLEANAINQVANTYKETSNTAYYRWNGNRYIFKGADTYERHNGGTDFSCPDDPSRGTGSACPTVSAANTTGLSTPVDKETPTLPEFSELVVVTREQEAAAMYEVPEDGDPAAFIARAIAEGKLPANPASGTDQATATTQPNGLTPQPASCDVLNGMSTYPPDLQLSPNFKLGDLNANGKRAIQDQMGLTKAQIVCNLKGLCENVLEKVLAMYPGATITSGFRRPGDVGESSPTSQHYNGEAADIVITGLGRQGHYDAIQAIQKAVPYDKLILEYYGATTVWIHVAFKYSGARHENYTFNNHQKYGANNTFTLLS